MTSRGLSWWDAQIIIFRFYGFHERRSYMKDEIQSLIDEIDVGIDDSYRAFLTVERLFRHDFNAGQVAREIIEHEDPKLFEELESALIEGGSPRRASNLLIISALIFLLFSILSMFLESYMNVSLFRYYLVADTLFTMLTSFSLIGTIRFSLEIPELTPAFYNALKNAANFENENLSHN
ncbi:MAG: hypothetical protein P1Q69_19525 [Candidatus Thorarchaeota archaeon]|nr:hypothetical protein [Candidatus Thorarchaeota archaeon]